MAEASDDADVDLVCSLCLEQFVHPRKLPDCGHCFCEACLITYMTKLNDNKELENKLKCPVCTMHNTIPEGIDIKEWVMLLETYCVNGQRKGLKEQDGCASCKSLGRESRPTIFCLDCSEKLCQFCTESRHTFKLMKHHKYIDIEKAFKNDDGAKTISMLSEYLDLSCDSHPNEAINYYCKDNDVFCCAACRYTDHKKCNSVLKVEELVEEISAKREKKCMNDLISDLSKYAETVMKTIESCVTDYKKKVEEIGSHFKEIRTKINQIMDSFEEAINDQARAMAKQHALMTTEVTDRLKEMADNLQVYKGLTETIEAYGSGFHQYIIAKNLMCKIRDQETAILDTTRTFSFTELSLKPQNTLLEILQIGINDTHKLAYVEEQAVNNRLPIYDGASLLEYDKITKTCHKLVQGNYNGSNEPTYDSLVYLPNNDFVLIDTHNEGHCILAQGDGTVVASRDFKYCADTSTGSRKPYCATVIKNGEIAVSIPEKKKICIISADKQLKSTFTGSTKYKPRAIHGLRTGDIAVSFDDPVAFGIISFDEIPEPTEKLHVYFSHDKEGRKLKTFDCMAVDETRSNVIQPCTTDEAVYCFDFNGNPKFKYEGKDEFSPMGVAVDGYGSIFVCDSIYNNSAIHVISPTGNAVCVIQQSEGCP